MSGENCMLEEAWACGPGGPLRLAGVFGISDSSAIRNAEAAWQILAAEAEAGLLGAVEI